MRFWRGRGGDLMRGRGRKRVMEIRDDGGWDG